MNIITPTRELWRRRRLVGLAGVLALLLGCLVAYSVSFLPPKLQKRAYTVGVANSRVFVDTPASQVVEVNPRGSDTLGARAQLLSNVMTDGVLKASIARTAGLRPRQLVATSDAAASADAGVLDERSEYLLKTSVVTNAAGEQLPIIEIETHAPNARAAAALASAAVKGLDRYLDQRATVEGVPAAKRLRVGGLGPPQTRLATRGPGLLLALSVTLLSFLAGCGLILAGSRLVRGWREADASELLEDADRLPSAQEVGEPLGHPHLLPPAGRAETEAGRAGVRNAS